MPTGYTAPIADGITFNQFVLGCARAFGACIEMRDDPQSTPIPEEFKPSDYHLTAGHRAKAELQRLLSLTEDQVAEEAEAEHTASCKSRQESATTNKALLAAYEDMLTKVEAWVSPSPDHQGLKEFMVKQIKESIDWDCDREYEEPKRISSEEWLTARIEQYEQDVKYHAEKYAEEVERVTKRNQWIAQLRTSLEQTKE